MFRKAQTRTPSLSAFLFVAAMLSIEQIDIERMAMPSLGFGQSHS